MACFIAPAGVAVVTTIVGKIVKKREGTSEDHGVQCKGKWTQRLRWLNTMLWGGTVLLALEHVWRGELVPFPPFLTAFQTAEGVGPVLREIATYGATMTAAVVLAWAIMVGVAELRIRARRMSEAEAEAAVRGE